jgi:four helix bundle protein
MTQVTKKYNLEERTAKFGEDIIGLCQSIKQNTVNRSIVDQLIRSSTSIGANYMEANGASSKKDFRNKMHICKKEAQETQRKHWQEAHELVLIFQKNNFEFEKMIIVN